MKNLYSVLFCSSMICCSLIAAPQDVVVESGQVSVRHETPHHMIMEVSDQAILSYQSFDIAKGEKVQFIQPSPSSSVLNRVRGGKMSEIMGSLESNGKVFLVNPRGIYFGKDAVVRVGSLVASTLQMANEDFLAGRYLFHLQEERARICNEGQIYAEGSIALISSSVSNQGLLVSQHGTVALASGEHVTLTFEGDDLLQFAVEGETKDALIEQAGVIQALEGRVWMKMATAKKTIQEVVNRSGIEVGEVFVHEGGEIFLVSASAILAKKVHIEAPSLEVAGKIDVSSGQGQGGDIALSGGMILLQRAHVDASGELGGGNVCIDAQVVQMDKDSCISVDASFSGSGGNVLLNAEKMMTFQGQVYARGGRKLGDGGFVESSSKRGLMIDGARVDTSAFSGHMGLWLLDPVTLTIGATGGGLPTGCFLADAQIDVTTLESASSSVFLCADTIIQEVPIAMINPGAGLTFSTPPDSEEGTLILQGGDISTVGGSIIVDNMKMQLEVPVIISTVAGGSTGSDITLKQVESTGGAHSLSLLAGSGAVTIGNLGKNSPLGAVTIVSSGGTILRDIFTRDASIIAEGPISLAQDVTMQTSSQGAMGGDITLGKVDALPQGVQALTLIAGTEGVVHLENVGEKAPLGGLTITDAKKVFVRDIQVVGSIQIVPPLILTLGEHVIQTSVPIDASEVLSLGDVNSVSAGGAFLTLLADIDTNISLGNVGKEAALTALAVHGHQGITLQDVYAEFLEVANGEGNLSLQGNIILSGDCLLAGGNMFFGGEIQGQHVVAESIGPMLRLGGNQVIAAETVYLNSVQGSVGSQKNPLHVNETDKLTIGAKGEVFLSGEIAREDLHYVHKNKPCYVLINTSRINNCHRPTRKRFLHLKKSTFATIFAGPERLGIGYGDLPFQVHKLSSSFQQLYLSHEPQKAPVGFISQGDLTY